ncbi:hypothetical protein IV203_015688 [Nitzschia inconspicua]|uniref:Uncharacterized protein n=1 Tax=Nitzschia inconspicua TaxID=303405 RepID=A0A9K3PVW4_9STRA|nr:hypothetical protein IV203_015688 [Nitzschia inconspicua]
MTKISDTSDHCKLEEGSTLFQPAQTVGKFGNFFLLSENARHRAQAAVQRKKQEPLTQSKERRGRRSSILGSLDKFLSDESEATECTGSLTHQSSISSGLTSLESSCLTKTTIASNSTIAESIHSNVRPLPPKGNGKSHQRPGRRGSVTRHSLDASTISSLSSSDDGEFIDFEQLLFEEKAHHVGTVISAHQSSAPSIGTIHENAIKKERKNRHSLKAHSSKLEGNMDIPIVEKSHKSSKACCSNRANIERCPSNGCSIPTIDRLPIPFSRRSSKGCALGHDVDHDADADSTSVQSTKTSRIKPSRHDPTALPQTSTRREGRATEANCNVPDGDGRIDCHPLDSIDCSQVPSQRRYQRRGSVTKYALDCSLRSLDETSDQGPRNEFERTAGHKPLPPRPERSSCGAIPSYNNSVPTPNKSGGRHRPWGSLGKSLASLPSDVDPKKDLQSDQISIGSYCSEGGIASSRKRYQRRGSVTKFSLEDAQQTGTQNAQHHSAFHFNPFHSHDDLKTHSEHPLPRPRAAKNLLSSSHHCNETKFRNSGDVQDDSGSSKIARYPRRGSVTKYSLDN